MVKSTLEDNPMATLYVRNFPDDLYESMQELTEAEKESINVEVIDLVRDIAERRLRKQRRLQAMAEIEELGKSFRPLPDGVDSVALLREDRDR